MCFGHCVGLEFGFSHDFGLFSMLLPHAPTPMHERVRRLACMMESMYLVDAQRPDDGFVNANILQKAFKSGSKEDTFCFCISPGPKDTGGHNKNNTHNHGRRRSRPRTAGTSRVCHLRSHHVLWTKYVRVLPVSGS